MCRGQGHSHRYLQEWAVEIHKEKTTIKIKEKVSHFKATKPLLSDVGDKIIS